VPRLCELYSGICLTTEEKARKTLSQGSQIVPVGTMKIHKHTIKIHKKGKAIPLQAWIGLESSRRLRLLAFKKIGT